MINAVALLQSWSGQTLGVYSSFEELAKGVDYWMDVIQSKDNQRYSLTYRIEKLNSSQTLSWDYAYIHPSEYAYVKYQGIHKGGVSEECFPTKSKAGLNLIKENLHSLNEEPINV